MKRTGVSLYGLVILGCMLVMIASCGKREEKDRESGTAADTPAAVPAISSVEILPERPSKSSLLEAMVKFAPPGTADLRYRWIKNGKEIMGAAEGTLGQDNFQKGDTIAVEVTPYLGKVNGNPVRSNPIIIANSPPVLKSFTIEPMPAHSTDELTAGLDMFDADGEYVRSSYQWKKGKEDIPGATETTLAPDYFKKGDSIGCQVRVSDGESPEASYYSNEIVILNSAPSITSQPSAEKIEGSSYEYQVAVADPDEDKVTFSLLSAPEGMTIDSETGLIAWQISDAQRVGKFAFEIIARDPEGARAVQPITLSLSSNEGEQAEAGD